MMNLTEKQVKLFQGLQGSETGRTLAEFLSLLINQFCDIREMTNLTPESIKARVDMAKLIEEECIDRITLANERKEPNPNKYA